jgi:hypothetical protein
MVPLRSYVPLMMFARLLWFRCGESVVTAKVNDESFFFWLLTTRLLEGYSSCVHEAKELELAVDSAEYDAGLSGSKVRLRMQNESFRR